MIIIEKKDGKIIGTELRDTITGLADGHYSVTITKGSKRSLEQNKLYRAILQTVSQESGNSIDDLHLFFKNMFLKEIVINENLGEITKIKSTTELTTRTFIEYLERVCVRCSENGIYIE